MAKRKEDKVIKSLGKAFPKMDQLEDTHRTETFDCENNNYIIEIKCRDKRYESWLFERSKYDSNLPKAKESGREFIYIVEFGGHCWAWNISKMDAAKHDFEWEERAMPKTTEFNNRTIINKTVGYVYEKDALHFNLL